MTDTEILDTILSMLRSNVDACWESSNPNVEFENLVGYIEFYREESSEEN